MAVALSLGSALALLAGYAWYRAALRRRWREPDVGLTNEQHRFGAKASKWQGHDEQLALKAAKRARRRTPSGRRLKAPRPVKTDNVVAPFRKVRR